MMGRETVAGIVAVGALIFSIVWIGVGIFIEVDNYNKNVYPFDQVFNDFSRAAGTNNLDHCADYIEDGLERLAGYSGNEQWWYPTDNTNMDVIKSDLQDIIDWARNCNATYGSDAYQEALDNTKEALSIQRGKVEEVKMLYFFNGRTAITAQAIWWTIFAIAIVIMFIAGFLAYD